MNDHDLINKDLSPTELEEITGTQKLLLHEIKQQRCNEAYYELVEVLPTMTGVMMEQIKYRINLEMKARREAK